MAKRISQLPSETAPAVGDEFPFYDLSTGTTKRASLANILAGVTAGTSIANAAIKAKHVDLGVADQTARDAITSPWEGLTVFRKDTDAFEVYDGTNWWAYDTKMQTYNPDIYIGATLWTKGNGVVVGRYFRQGKKITVWFEINIGSTTSFGATGTLLITLPIASAVSPFAGMPYGYCRQIDSGVANGMGHMRYSTSTRYYGEYITHGSGTFNSATITHAAPMGWANGDVWTGYFEYEAA